MVTTARIIIIYPNQLLSRIYLGPMAPKFNPGTVGKACRDGPGLSSYTVCYLVMYLVLWSKVKFNFHGVVVLHDAIYWHVPWKSWRVSTIVNIYTTYSTYTLICANCVLGHYSYTSSRNLELHNCVGSLWLAAQYFRLEQWWSSSQICFECSVLCSVLGTTRYSTVRYGTVWYSHRHVPRYF